MPAPAAEPAPSPPPGLIPVHFEYTANLPLLLQQLGVSLLISTYQGGKLAVIGTWQNTITFSLHNFELAMGVASQPGRIAVGTRRCIWFLHQDNSIAARLEPAGKHDACFLTRRAHVSGEIHGHDLAWAGADLWVVNTLFSCLCTLQEEFNFVPRWQPRFISALADEDRCHLNGLAVEGGQPRYVTALAETDTPAGWRPTKATTGCVIDVPSSAVVVRGLCMPHSPRLHGGRLWLLNSGLGELSTVDTAAGRVEPVARVPGYTRGLALFGPFAFVGMSQVRATSVFDDLPIAAKREQLKCGVAVIDLRSGQQVACFAFRSGITEIFAVEVLPGIRCPYVASPDPASDGAQTIWLIPRRATR